VYNEGPLLFAFLILIYAILVSWGIHSACDIPSSKSNWQGA